MVSMPHRFWTTTALFLTLTAATACNFDPSTANDGFDPERADETVPDVDDDSLVPKPPGEEEPPSLVFYPAGEETGHGFIVDGDYLDLDAMDATIEKVLGEIGDEGEKLEQRWEFLDVPAGQYEMTFAVKAFSPIDVERYQVSFRMSGSTEWIDIFRLSSGGVLTSYIYGIDVPARGNIEIQASLFGDTPIVEEAENEIGFDIWDGSGGGGGGPIGAQRAYRTLTVDYLGLRPTAPLN